MGMYGLAYSLYHPRGDVLRDDPGYGVVGHVNKNFTSNAHKTFVFPQVAQTILLEQTGMILNIACHTLL